MKPHVGSPFELVFSTTLGEVLKMNRRWSSLRHDLREIVCRQASWCSEPHGKQTVDTLCEIYLAPLNEKDNGRDQCPIVYRETVKHLKMKYPEFLPVGAGRYNPTFIFHNRSN